MKIGDRVFVLGYIDEIRKDTVIIRNAGGYFGTIPSEVIIGDLPSAQPQKGKWIYGEHEYTMCDGYRCDKCGFFVPWDYQHKFIDFIKDYNYCPSCGADMRSEAREYLEYGKLIAKGIEQGLRGDAE